MFMSRDGRLRRGSCGRRCVGLNVQGFVFAHHANAFKVRGCTRTFKANVEQEDIALLRVGEFKFIERRFHVLMRAVEVGVISWHH